MNAGKLAMSRSEVEIGGSGDCYINVSDTMRTTINGSGSVRYKGKPVYEKTTLNGSGSVESME